MAEEWEHLTPLVAALTDAGNSPVNGGFQETQGGMVCAFENALDSSVVAPYVERDPDLAYDIEADSVHCRHCWAGIIGGDCVARVREHSKSWERWDRANEPWADVAVWDIDGWQYGR